MGLHRRDIGTWRMNWHEFKVWYRNRGKDSAVFRSMHPRAWEWDLSVRFQAAILHTLQNANWQRGGGKGSRPKMLRPPGESTFDTSKSVAQRKTEQDAELARRRKARGERKSKLISGGGLKLG